MSFLRLVSLLLGTILILTSGVLILQRYKDSTVYWVALEVFADRPKFYGYYLVSPDGGVRRPLMSANAGSNGYNIVGWSPDATWVFFTSSYLQEGEGLYRIRANGTHRQQVVAGQVLAGTQMKLSPDGGWWLISVVTRTNHTLYKIRVDGSQVEPIHSSIGEPFQSYDWADEWINYSVIKDGMFQTYRVRTDGTENQALSTIDREFRIWSPDEAAYIEAEFGEHISWKVHWLETGETTPLEIEGLWIQAWLPNDWLLVHLQTGMIGRMRLDGSDLQSFLPDKTSYLWVHVSRDGQWVYIAAQEARQRVLYRVQVATLESQRLDVYEVPAVDPHLITVPPLNTGMPLQWVDNEAWLLMLNSRNQATSITRMRTDGTDKRTLFTLSSYDILDSIQISHDEEWVFVSTQNRQQVRVMQETVRIRLSDGKTESLGRGRVMSFSPPISLEWDGVFGMILGLIFTGIGIVKVN